MRQLIKNKRSKPFFALNYKKNEDVLDGNGKKTGEKKVIYYPAKTFYANITGAKGGMFVAFFGSEENYDKVISLSKYEFDKLGIKENTVFFIDKKPEYKDGSPIYDYRVYRTADSLNDILIAIKKVKD